MHRNTSNKPTKWRFYFAGLIFVVWVLVMAYASWWFQFKNTGSLNDYWASFNGSELFSELTLESSDRILIVNFLDPKCPCSRFASPHIEQLQKNYKGIAKFVDFNQITSTDSPSLQRIKNISIPASPAVAIWSTKGELAYFGPYSGGAVCGQGEDFVDATLTSLTAGNSPQWINQEAVGCFCKWT